MTGGEVAVLGSLAPNAGAGMTGGVLFLRRDQQHRINTEYVEAVPLDDEHLARLLELLREHGRTTQSQTASTWLATPERLSDAFVCVRPRP
jgi:glutamate synthase domain-containing protein 3